jgi:hypothetical protein
MSKNTWDAVLASAPLNSTAGRVASGGVHYEPEFKALGREWDAPPRIIRPSKTHLNNPDFTDFTGKKWGRLTALGMLAEGSGHAAIWVCRCSCGKYVGRRAKAAKNAAPEDRCQSCQHTAMLIQSASGENARRRASDTTKRRWNLP